MKTRINSNAFVLFNLLVLVVSCRDIIEDDIAQKKITVHTPSDNFQTDKYNVMFWWDSTEGIQKYRLQIVTPSFNSITALVVDTLITSNKARITLFPGNYQWRIRGENGSTQTAYLTRTLTVDSNIDLTGQLLETYSPTNDHYTNSSSIVFTWAVFPNADEYEFVITDTVGTTIRTQKKKESSITDNLSEGWYLWKVRALNTKNSTTTQFSTSKKLTVDITPPGFSTPMQPADLSSANNPVQLTWNRAIDVSDDNIIVATDSLFQQTILNENRSSSSLDLPVLEIGATYYWRIRSRDRSGNWSGYSKTFRFTVTF